MAEEAKKADLFEHILVSTDCERIAEIAIKFGAEVPFLRTEYNDNHSNVSLATLSSLEKSEIYWNLEFDLVTQLMPNCPLRKKNTMWS